MPSLITRDLRQIDAYSSAKTDGFFFAFYACPSLILRRTNDKNIHVRGYEEEGTISTPFDMAVLNELDRYHLVIDAIDRLGADLPENSQLDVEPGTRDAAGVDIMKTDTREDYVLRDEILKMLSDAELSNVSTEETQTAMTVGQEFIDLKHIHDGVRTCGADQVVMGRVLSRKAVHVDTWEKILTAMQAAK